MARYIDADKFERELKDRYYELEKQFGCYDSYVEAIDECIDKIDNAPTADVQEVIYCKNCKNYYKFGNGDVVCEEFGGYIKDNGFCSRGERKDGKD